MSRFDDLGQDGRDALRLEFENPNTTDERRVEILEMVREGANEAGIGVRCPSCRNYPFYIPHDKALIEGHVYSTPGLAEIQITRYCEFCFDVITEEPEED